MKTPRARTRAILTLPAVAILISACATTIDPDYMDPGLSPAKIDKITVFPAIDLRKERSIVIDRETLHALMIYWGLMPSRMERIGYPEIDYLPVGIVGAASITPDDIAEAKPKWINTLGPASAKWVLIITLDDFVSVATYGFAASTKCSGYLFDKGAGKLVWRHRVGEERGEPGLFGLLGRDLTFEAESFAADTLRRCAVAVVEQFPPRRVKN